jgi:hypothetical protein
MNEKKMSGGDTWAPSLFRGFYRLQQITVQEVNSATNSRHTVFPEVSMLCYSGGVVYTANHATLLRPGATNGTPQSRGSQIVGFAIA